MAARPVNFDKYSFPSVNKAKAECKRIRDKYAAGEKVSDPADEAFLRALVAEHRNSEAKIGSGIERFEVASNSSLGARAGNLGIWIKQVGKSELVDFGYGGVVEWIADPGNERQEGRRVERALRNAIRPLTDQFLADCLSSAQPLTSCLTGKALDPTQPIDVLHDRPRWGQLVEEFVGARGGYSAVLTRQTEQSLGEVLVDDSLRDAWVEFHRQRATLGLATPEENAQRSKGAGG